MSRIRSPVPVLLFALTLVLIAVGGGCSSSSDPSGTGPSPTGNYVSGRGLVPIGSQAATMMINIGAGSAGATRAATGRLQIGANEFENLVGEYRPESENQVALGSAPGVIAAEPYAFLGNLEGSTITGSLSGGNVSGTVPVTLAATSVPIEAVVLLGSWDYSHAVSVGVSFDGVDPCPVPAEYRTITESCFDRYQIEIDGDTLPATSCGEVCLPDVDLATGSLDGTRLTLQIPEVGEPTTPANRLFSIDLPGCEVIWTGAVELNGLSGETTLVNLLSECRGSGTGCDPYCTNGRLHSACGVRYELGLDRCEGGCECPK